MASSFNCFLNKLFLCTEIWLKLQDSLVAAACAFRITFLFALATELCTVKSSFQKDSFDSLGLVWILKVIWQEYHVLDNFMAIMDEPTTAHMCLLSTGFHIHAR